MSARIKKLLESFENNDSIAIIEANKSSSHSISYHQLFEGILKAKEKLDQQKIKTDCVIGIQSDFHINSIEYFLALLTRGNVVALLSPQNQDISEIVKDADIERVFHFDASSNISVTEYELSVSESSNDSTGNNKLLQQLFDQSEPGFIIFSSGTTGKPKAILHGAEKFLVSFENANKRFSTLAFLLFDHIAGVDTLFYTLFSKGTLVLPSSRNPVDICKLVEQHKVEVLPASPSFLRLLFMSGVYESADLSSVQIVTFGSEPMNETGLANLDLMFPKAKSIQKYGTSEFGSPRSKSRSENGLWIHMDGENCKTKVVDETLWVKSSGSMLGYLNAPQPEIVDGWMNTGDRVEVDGEWIRILGRESDIINVGGEKVYPSEVENIISELKFVEDVLVYSEENAIMGNMVCARIKIVGETSSDNKKTYRKTLRTHCLKHLEPFKIPSKIEFTQDKLTNERQKKVRT
jgi:acyl-CoA synthetase (AMP-forming)/AMP-acid ligase II